MSNELFQPKHIQQTKSQSIEQKVMKNLFTSNSELIGLPSAIESNVHLV